MSDSTTVLLQKWGEASFTSFGFFWKAGWAFILGYFISSMIQVFVPKTKLVKLMGRGNAQSISLATLFGAISSSCSFAALSTARSLFQKGASFAAVVAFMFASTNLVIELGALIFIFLGWQYLAAEIVGGFLLIIISTLLIKLVHPRGLVDDAKERLRKKFQQEETFDWRERIASRKGWLMVGHRFVMEWKMVWEDILIGFTLAGFVAVFVPSSFWSTIFLSDVGAAIPGWLQTLENAAVAPFVAAATFIGSMGNIPLATVLNANGVMFAGIMGFIYSDLMVPPLVRINAKYYGWRLALYIAGNMYLSIVATALLLHTLFDAAGLTPRSQRVVGELVNFSLDYTFWLNLFFVLFSIMLTGGHLLFRRRGKGNAKGMQMNYSSPFKRVVVMVFLSILLIGLVLHFAL